MVKYSSDLKAKVVGEYLNGDFSASAIASKYKLPRKQVSLWIQSFKLNGADSLKRRKTNRIFSEDFKLSVINYYQTHDESLSEVGAKFDIRPCQVSAWRSAFNQNGIDALKAHPKGRPSKMKHSKKKYQKSISKSDKSEVERLKEELVKKNKELYDTKLERDILKKSMTLFGPSKAEKNTNSRSDQG